MPWLSPRGISNMHGACIVPSAAALSSLNYPQRNSLRARARGGGRESFSRTEKPFDPKQNGRWENTLRSKSSAASRPCRTPCSASAVSSDDRYGELLKRQVCKHTVCPHSRARSFFRSIRTCDRGRITHVHAMCGSHAKPSMPARQVS